MLKLLMVYVLGWLGKVFGSKDVVDFGGGRGEFGGEIGLSLGVGGWTCDICLACKLVGGGGGDICGLG